MNAHNALGQRDGRRRLLVAGATSFILLGMLFAQTAAAEEPDPEPALVSVSQGAEPSVAEMQRAAVELAGLEPQRVRGWERRVRLAPLAPSFHVRFGRVAGDLFSTTDANGITKLTSGDHVSWQFNLGASWSLDRLVFHPEEVRLAREAQRMSAYRGRLVVEVARLYYERRRLQVALAANRGGHEASPDEETEARLQLDELTAELDGLTGGLLGSASSARARPACATCGPP